MKPVIFLLIPCFLSMRITMNIVLKPSFLQVGSNQDGEISDSITAEKTLENTENSSNNSSNPKTSSHNQSNKTSEEPQQINYDILDDDDYGDEVREVKTGIAESGNYSLQKIANSSENIKRKIDDITEKIEAAVDNFAIKIINKTNELNEILFFSELGILKLSMEVISSEINEIVSEIFRLKNSLAELLKIFPFPIKTICNIYASCADCLRNPNCGWCQESQSCVLGDEKGPRFDICQFYAFEKCDSNNCLKYKECSSCLEDPFCGWCVDEERHMEGCIPGLRDFKSCPKWYYSTFLEKPQCPKPVKKTFSNTEPDISMENLPEEQRKLLLRQEEEILRLDEKIDEVHSGLSELRHRIVFYETKYKAISGKVNASEIAEIRERINFRHIQNDLFSKAKVEKAKILNAKASNAQKNSTSD